MLCIEEFVACWLSCDVPCKRSADCFAMVQRMRQRQRGTSESVMLNAAAKQVAKALSERAIRSSQAQSAERSRGSIVTTRVSSESEPLPDATDEAGSSPQIPNRNVDGARTGAADDEGEYDHGEELFDLCLERASGMARAAHVEEA